MSDSTLRVNLRGDELVMSDNKGFEVENRWRKKILANHTLILARRKRLTIATPVKLTVTVQSPSGTQISEKQAWPSIQAMLNGLVSAGVITNDVSSDIQQIVVQQGPDVDDTDYYRFTLAFTPTTGEGH